MSFHAFNIELILTCLPFPQVLCQEMLRYNRLIEIIRNSLINLEKAIAGLQVMSGDLEKVFKSMGVGQVPAMWMGKSFPSLMPLGAYVDDLFRRLKMLDVSTSQARLKTES